MLKTSTILAAGLAASHGGALASNEDKCQSAQTQINIANTTLVYTSHHSAGEVIPLPGTVESCGGPNLNTTITSNLCRFVMDTATSDSSSVHIEAWLPDDWNGRFLATGNGGLGGCISYDDVQNGASLGFASFGMNAGHNGSEDVAGEFLNKPEVIIDFGHRAMHAEAVVGKELISQYYGRSADFNYYAGCSTGGRQGFSTATHYPDDFDGMLLGAAGVEWIRIVTQWHIQAMRYGWPDVHSPQYVTNEQFQAIAAKTIELYDELDGVKDGVIDNPTHLRLDPQIFSCGTGILNDTVCLRNAQQVEAVRLAYEPITDLQGNFTYPPFNLGADPTAFSLNEENGTAYFPSIYVRDYFRGIVFNDTTWSDKSLTIADVEHAVGLNAGLTNTGIAEARMGEFKKTGGKIISYHGLADELVSSELSQWYFNGAMANMNASLDEMLDFYRLFFVPGMNHCETGPGAWNFGQAYPLDKKMLDAKHNALLALVDWVEKGHAPSELVGTKYSDDDVEAEILAQRKHCVYPKQSVWDREGSPSKEGSWKCVYKAS